jgi:signal transduction histidine kinase
MPGGDPPGPERLLRSLVAVARATAESGELDPTLHNTLGVVCDITGARGASILLLDEEGRLVRSLSFGHGELRRDDPQVARLIVQGLAGWVARHRQTALLPDTLDDPRWVQMEGGHAGWRSALAVPVASGSTAPVAGVLTLVHLSPGHFTEEHKAVMETAAAQIALAVRNAQVSDTRLRLVQALERETAREREIKQLREDLVKTMVHDLRNPLTAVLAAVDIAAESPALPPDLRRVLHIARANAERQLALITSLLELSRLEQGPIELRRTTFPVAEVVAEVLQLADAPATRQGVGLGSDVTEAVVASADRGLLHRVVENLVANAIKFTPAGGFVRVSASTAHSGELRLSVRDTGPGVPPSLRPRLFQMFAAGDQPGRGSGLGLAFCRLAAEAHGGTIALDGEGPGSGFVVTLPPPPAAGA